MPAIMVNKSFIAVPEITPWNDNHLKNIVFSIWHDSRFVRIEPEAWES